MTTKNSSIERIRILTGCLLALLSLAVTGCEHHQGPPVNDKSYQATRCAIQLKMFADAKQSWADQNNKFTNDTPAMADLMPFIRCGTNCPGGGTYTVGKVGELPTCSIPEHQAAFLKRLVPASQTQ